MKTLISGLLTALLLATQVTSVKPSVHAAAVSPATRQQATTPTDPLEVIDDIRAHAPSFAADFSADDGTWRTEINDESAFAVVDDSYHITIGTSDYLDWSSAGLDLDDFLAEVQTTFVAGAPSGQYGIFFRAVDDEQAYLFTISGHGTYQLYLLAEADYDMLVEETASAVVATGSGAVNQLAVLAQGSRLTLLVNDTVVAEVEDDTFSRGDLALMAGTLDGADIEIAFDNLQVWALAGLSAMEPPGTGSSLVPTATTVPEPTLHEGEGDVLGFVVDLLMSDLAILETVRAGEPVAEDSFTRDRGQWTTGAEAGVNRFYAKRAYHIAVVEASRLGLSRAGLDEDDFLVEVQTTALNLPDNSYCGLVFRYQDDENFYAYAVNAAGEFTLDKYVDGEMTTLYAWETSDVLATGDQADNRLGVLAYGPDLLLIANDTVVVDVHDDTFRGGDVALMVGTQTQPDAEVAFDDFAIWDAVALAGYFALTAEATRESPLAPTAATFPFDPAVVDTIYAMEPQLSDSFTRNRGIWDTQTTAGAERFFADRTYHIHVIDADTVSWTTAQSPIADFMAEVEVTQIAGAPDSNFGLLFRFQDAANFYRFAISGDGTFTVDKKVDDVWMSLLAATASASLEPGPNTRNRLGVLASGSTIVVMANDTVLATLTDDTFADGDIALFTGTFATPDAEVAFDDFELWDLAPLGELLPTTEPAAALSAPVFGTRQLTFDPTALEIVHAAEPLVSENFTRDRGAWSTESGDDFAHFYADRAYHMRLDAPEMVSWSMADLTLADFLIEADVTKEAGSAGGAYGFLVRVTDADNLYFFAIRSDGQYGFQREVAGTWEALIPASPSDAIEQGMGTINRIGILGLGARFVLLVNDTVLATIEDETFASGSIGLGLLSGDDAIEIAVDDLEIWDLAPLIDELAGAFAIQAVPVEGMRATIPIVEPDASPMPERIEPGAMDARLDAIRAGEPTYVVALERDEGYVTVGGDVDVDYFFEDDGYHIYVHTPNMMGGSGTGIYATDFYLEVEATQIDDLVDTEYGVLFRAQDMGNYDTFRLTGYGEYALDQFVDDAWYPLVHLTAADAIETGAGSTNRLGLLVEGATITLLVNDTVLDVTENEQFGEGEIGLTVSSPPEEEGSEAVFHNLRIWDLSVSGEMPPTPTPATVEEAGDLGDIEILWDPLDSYFEMEGDARVEFRSITPAQGVTLSANVVVADVVWVDMPWYGDFYARFYDEDGTEVAAPALVLYDPTPVYVDQIGQVLIILPENWDEVRYIDVE